MSNESSKNDGPSAESLAAGYEVSDVSIPAIIIFAVCCVATIAVCIVAVDGYFVHSKEKYLREANRYQHTELTELTAAAQGKLSSYGVVDKDNKVYRIPVDQAMKLMAEEAFSNTRD
jgi:hypothetical protein